LLSALKNEDFRREKKRESLSKKLKKLDVFLLFRNE